MVAGVKAGEEDIRPEVVSRETGKAFFANPKALERQVGAPAEEAAAQGDPRMSPMEATPPT